MSANLEGIFHILSSLFLVALNDDLRVIYKQNLSLTIFFAGPNSKFSRCLSGSLYQTQAHLCWASSCARHQSVHSPIWNWLSILGLLYNKSMYIGLLKTPDRQSNIISAVSHASSRPTVGLGAGSSPKCWVWKTGTIDHSVHETHVSC